MKTTTKNTTRKLEAAPFQPTQNRIVAVPVEPSETTASGLIVIPDRHRAPTYLARVLAVGSKVKEDIRRGDVICYEPYSATEIERELAANSNYLIIPENKVLYVEREA